MRASSDGTDRHVLLQAEVQLGRGAYYARFPLLLFVHEHPSVLPSSRASALLTTTEFQHSGATGHAHRPVHGANLKKNCVRHRKLRPRSPAHAWGRGIGGFTKQLWTSILQVRLAGPAGLLSCVRPLYVLFEQAAPLGESKRKMGWCWCWWSCFGISVPRATCVK